MLPTSKVTLANIFPCKARLSWDQETEEASCKSKDSWSDSQDSWSDSQDGWSSQAAKQSGHQAKTTRK